jgi:hypothetical protein
MKLDVVKSLITVAFSALLAYACYEICNYEHVQWVIAAGAFVSIGTPMMLAFGVSSQQERSSVMLKTLSWVFLLIEIVSNGVFVFFDFSIPVYIIVNGLILLMFLLIYNSIYRTKM